MVRRKTIFGLETMAWLLLLPLLFRQVSAQSVLVYNNNTVECDIGGGDIGFGYTSVVDLQQDVDAERSRINGGGAPFSSYFFQLCAGQDFTITGGQEFRPSLNNIVIRCGVAGTGNVADDCTFRGGDVQVVLEDFAATPNPVTNVFFRGVTFSNFDEAVVGGGASDITTVVFENSLFTDFQSDSLTTQEVDSAPIPFQVELLSSNVTNGVASNGFVVEQGNLVLDNVDVSGVNISGSLVSAAGNNALVSLVSTVVEDSLITNVVNVQNGADASLDSVNVQDMVSVSRTILASGVGTTAVIDDLQVLNNRNEPWQYVEATANSSVSVFNSQFANNQNVTYGFNANNGATMLLDNVRADGNQGAQGSVDVVSTIVYAAEEADITVLDSRFSFTDLIDVALFSFENSNIDATRTCLSFIENTQVLAFTQFGSTMGIREDNGIELSPDSAPPDEQLCPTDGLRLLAENITQSNCFIIPADCTFECENWAAFDDCSQIPLRNTTTNAPSSSPSSQPSLSTAPSSTPSLSPSSTPTLSSIPSSTPTLSALPTAPITSQPSFVPTTLPPGTTALPTEQPSDQPSVVPTNSLAPTSTEAPTVLSRTSAPSGAPSSLPTIVVTQVPTTTTRSPTRSPSPTGQPSEHPSAFPTTSSVPSSVPTESAAPTTSNAPSRSPAPSSQPSISSAPSNLPSISQLPSSLPSSPIPEPTPIPTPIPTILPPPVPPNTLPPIFGPQPSLPPDRTATIAPTRCRVRPPSKGKGRMRMRKGKGKGSRRDVRELAYTYVYHKYVYVDDPSDKLPFCDEFPTPQPTRPPHIGHAGHAPYYYYYYHQRAKSTKSTKSGGKKR